MGGGHTPTGARPVPERDCAAGPFAAEGDRRGRRDLTIRCFVITNEPSPGRGLPSGDAMSYPAADPALRIRKDAQSPP